MISPTTSGPTPLHERLLARLVHIERGEIAGLLCSFAYFFSVLTAYYIVRPVRDEMGVVIGPDALKWTFTYVFGVMLAAVPVFGWIASRFPRRQVVPIVYLFFIANLALFWLAFETSGQTRRLAQTFFIWASVFNLFVVSLFWSLMSELWASAQAKRLYGFIAAGGSAGALTGPFVTQALVTVVGPNNLLLVSAAFLGLALVFVTLLRAAFVGGEPQGQSEVPDHGVLGGIVQVARSPYLLRIALWVLLANLIVTYFYIEQSRIVGAVIADRAARVQLFARMDLTVSLATIALQVLVTGRLIERLGLGPAAASLPLVAIVGFVALAVAPVLSVIVTIMVVERTIGFAFANPAARVLWTVVEPEEKYKAQNFIDTVVFRGGDAASGWVFNALGRDGLGLGGASIAFLTLPFAVLWLWVSFSLAGMQAERARDEARKV